MLTVHQVADATNIKTDHIRAIEASEWGVFAAPVYIRGFARNYSRYLRLDDQALVAELESELGRTDDHAGPPSLSGGDKGPLDFIMLQLSRVRWQWVFPVLLGTALMLVGLVLLGTALMLVGFWAYKAWTTRPKHDPLSGLGSGLRQPKRPGPATLPLPTNAPAGRR